MVIERHGYKMTQVGSSKGIYMLNTIMATNICGSYYMKTTQFQQAHFPREVEFEQFESDNTIVISMSKGKLHDDTEIKQTKTYFPTYLLHLYQNIAEGLKPLYFYSR